MIWWRCHILTKFARWETLVTWAPVFGCLGGRAHGWPFAFWAGRPLLSWLYTMILQEKGKICLICRAWEKSLPWMWPRRKYCSLWKFWTDFPVNGAPTLLADLFVCWHKLTLRTSGKIEIYVNIIVAILWWGFEGGNVRRVMFENCNSEMVACLIWGPAPA